MTTKRRPGTATLERKVRLLENQIEAYQREANQLRERRDEAMRQQNEAIKESRFFREIVKRLIRVG